MPTRPLAIPGHDPAEEEPPKEEGRGPAVHRAGEPRVPLGEAEQPAEQSIAHPREADPRFVDGVLGSRRADGEQQENAGGSQGTEDTLDDGAEDQQPVHVEREVEQVHMEQRGRDQSPELAVPRADIEKKCVAVPPGPARER